MKSSIFKILMLSSFFLLFNSCNRFDMEHIMLTVGIPKNVNCSFIDQQGNDLVKTLIENNKEILLEENAANKIIKSDYYSLELKINGVNVQPEDIEIEDNKELFVKNSITDKEAYYTIYFGWKNLFTDEFLESKNWRDLNIEYNIVFPKLFNDSNEHLLKCKIRKGPNGSPILTNIFFDGKPIELSDYMLNSANFCFITLN